MIYEYLTSKADATHHCMVGFSIENTLSDNGTVSRGICRAAEGMLTDIEEHTEVGYREDGKIHGKDISGTDRVIPEGSPVSMNLLGFGTAFVQVMKERFAESLDRVLEENPMKGEIYLPSMLNDELQNNRASMQVLHSGDKWYGVTYREDRESVVNALAEMKQQESIRRIYGIKENNMCGIVGYIGTKEPQDIIINGLKKLEYRGYDSAGIAVVNHGKIELRKHVGAISNLEN